MADCGTAAMKTFPNKVIQKAYEKAVGKTFTHIPSAQVFVDRDGNRDYNYRAMLWLKDQGILEEKINWDIFVYEYRIVK